MIFIGTKTVYTMEKKKLNLENLTTEEKEQLQQYVNSLKEIKKEIGKLIKKGGQKKMDEEGGNKFGLYLNI